MIRLLIIPAVLMLAVDGSPKKEEALVPPAPTLTVSYERVNIRQSDCVNVEILLVNNSDYELTKPALTVTGPSFVHWCTKTCEEKCAEAGNKFGSPATPALWLDTIPPRSTLRR